MLTGAVVSLIVGSGLILIFARSQKLIYEKDRLKDKIREHARELEQVNASLLLENTRRRLAERRIVALIDALPDVIYFKDTHSRNLVVNHAFEKLIGMKKEEIEGRTDKELLPPVLAEHCRKQDEEIIRSGRLMKIEEEHDFHGVTLFQETIKVPLLDERGDVTSLVGITRDITERKLAERQLRQSEERFRRSFESMGVGASMADLKGRFIEVNRSLCNMLGYTEEELLSRTFSDVSHPDDVQIGMDAARRLVQGEITHTVFEKRYVRKDGRQIHVVISPTIIRDSDGNPLHFMALFQDITERKEAEKRMREVQERFRSIVTGAPIVFFCADRDGIFTLSEGKGLETLGLKPNQVVGQSVFELYRDAPEIIEDYSRVLKGESLRHVAHLGDLWYDTFLSPITDDNGDVQGVLGVANDISERKRAENDLLKSLEERGLLIQEIHHRVKNNMQVISSLLQLQSKQVADESMRSLFRESQDRIRSMAFVHEELYRSTDMRKVDMEDYLKNLSRSLCSSYGVNSDRIALTIAVENMAIGIETAIPCGLILNELISNALKHAFPDGAGGEVKVSLSRAGEGSIVLDVSDNGIGLPLGFNIRDGESMGMSLITTLAEMQLGGAIRVNQEQGTRFNITFQEHTRQTQ